MKVLIKLFILCCLRLEYRVTLSELLCNNIYRDIHYSFSLKVAVDPISFPGVAVVSEPLALAVPESVVEVAPVDSLVADVATPSMVNIVFELAFVNEVMALSSQALEPSVLIDLSECCLGVVLTDSQIIVNGALCWRVSNDVLCVQDSQLVPFLQAIGKVLPIMKRWDKSWIVLGWCLEFINQLLRQIRLGIPDT